MIASIEDLDVVVTEGRVEIWTKAAMYPTLELSANDALSLALALEAAVRELAWAEGT